ncbi:hypothetical protein LEN26_011066, partial [Aphanomyces euteiches]
MPPNGPSGGNDGGQGGGDDDDDGDDGGDDSGDGDDSYYIEDDSDDQEIAENLPHQRTAKAPKLKDFKVYPLFDGKEKYAGLGSNFPSWIRIFEDAIEADKAFNGTTWSDEQRFHALMHSITGNAKTFAQDSKTQQPITSYKEMVKRLRKHYSTHLTQLQLTQLMQRPKRWEMTWNEHLTYLHHVQSMANVGNEFVLDCLAIHACPSKKDDLLAHINPANKDNVEEQTKLIGILTRIAGSGINFGKRKQQPPAAANTVVGNNNKDGKKPTKKDKGKPPAKATRPCGICKNGATHFFSDCPIVKMGQEAKAKQGQATGAASLVVAALNADKPAASQLAAASCVFNETAADDDDDFDDVAEGYLADADAFAHRCTNPAVVASTDWICDSGCTHHLTNNESWTSNPEPSTLRVRVANSTVIAAVSKGSATLTLLDGRQIRLHEVHFVPSLQSNLLSITTLNLNKIDVNFGSTVDFVDRVTGATLLHGSRKNRLPVLECAPPPTTEVESAGLAFHVSHPKRSLAEWHDTGARFQTGPFHDLKLPCLNCARGKQTRNAQPKTGTGESAPTDEPGAVICADLLGPITPSDRNKNCWVAVYVDHNTKFKVPVPMKLKSNQTQEFITFKNRIEKQFGVQVKVLRTDGGGEFLSAEMDAYLKANGIRKQTTQPHTSVSNGEAENAIRTMANDARTFMLGCDIPMSLWGYAFRHSSYTRNRVPCKGNENWESPLFKLTGKHPKVSHILPFDSNCTVHQAPKEKSLARRADLGVILGVNEEVKGYDVYLPQQNK